MDRHTANEIVACLQGERTVYPYYRDRYSIGLLRHLSRQHRPDRPFSVAALKRSAYGSLCQKPRVKALLEHLGHRPLEEHYLCAHDHDPGQEHYLLSLATWGSERRWGRWRRQTSRPGFNLVLQLNFNSDHDRRFRQLGGRHSLFNYAGHPVSGSRNTLAWARIDLDWTSGCALIEEIQSDWIREVAWLAGRVESKLARGQAGTDPTRHYGLQCSLATARDYCAHVLERYGAVWAEAMLWASIQFIREELGLPEVFYHGEKGGRLLKGIRWNAPPRSLYTDLPRRFCFEPTLQVPAFLADDREVRQTLGRHPDISFFRLPAGEAR